MELYDIVFRAARFKDGKRVEKAMVTMYFNGKKVHDNQRSNRSGAGRTPAWMAETTAAKASPTLQAV